MRPPLLTDAWIHAAIRDVVAGGGRLTGVAVRRLLAHRHGARGGVTRIYRLLHEARRAVPDDRQPQQRAASTPPSEESREAAIARADLAELRERAHQERWARDTDALRQRMTETERVTVEGERSRHQVEDLTRALAAAQARITALERILAGRLP